MKKVINLELESSILETLEEYSKELNKTKTAIFEKALELYFDKLDETITDKRIDDLKNGKSEVVLLEEVFKKAGINV